MSSEILISRKEAKAAGLKHYFTGKPCKHGHVAKRRVPDGGCMECAVQRSKQWCVENPEYAKQYRDENPEKTKQWSAAHNKQYYEANAVEIKQYNKQYREENAESFKQQAKRWREENPDYCRLRYAETPEYHKQQAKRWREENPDYSKQYRKDNAARYNAHHAKRRATKLQATPQWSETDLILKVYEKRDELNSKWGTDYEVDHIIPLSSTTVCGLHVWANLQLLEAKDNSGKRNRYQKDW